MTPRWMTLKEAADYFGRSTGKIPAYRGPEGLRLNPDELDGMHVRVVPKHTGTPSAIVTSAEEARFVRRPTT